MAAIVNVEYKIAFFFGNRIGHFGYINILKSIQGFRVNIATFWSFLCLWIPKRDLDAKKTPPNMEVCPESLRAMLEFWYIELGLLMNNESAKKYYQDIGTLWIEN